MGLRIQLRRNQLALSEKNAAMAIWLGKQYLGQSDNPQVDEFVPVMGSGKDVQH